MDAAQWSALAAGASAVTAFLMYLIMRRNSLESARPEIVLDGWERRVPEGEGSARDEIHVSTIYNAGQGLARSIYMYAAGLRNDRPTYGMSTRRVPVLGPGEAQNVDCTITIYWENVRSDDGRSKFLPIEITVYCWDLRSRRHETHYNLMTTQVEPGEWMGGPGRLAPGVAYGNRITKTRGIRYLKLRRYVRDLWAKVGW